MMFALLIGLSVLGIATAGTTGGSRIRARGESKLAATADSELVLRRLSGDLSAAVKPPEVSGTGLTVQTRGGEVRWTFTAVAGGAGSGAERADASGSSRYFSGVLVAAALTPGDVAGHASVSLSLTARATQDAEPAQFGATFFLRGAHADPAWNPLD